MSTALHVVGFPVLARTLLLGEGAADLLRSVGLPVPGLFDTYLAEHCEVAQIAPRQYLVSALPTGAGALPTFSPPATVLCLATEYAEFAIGGDGWAALLPEITTADSAAPGASAWFPTQVCGLDAVVRRAATGFRVLCAPAEGPWLGSALEAQATTRGGAVIGFADYLGPGARD